MINEYLFLYTSQSFAIKKYFYLHQKDEFFCI